MVWPYKVWTSGGQGLPGISKQFWGVHTQDLSMLALSCLPGSLLGFLAGVKEKVAGLKLAFTGMEGAFSQLVPV